MSCHQQVFTQGPRHGKSIIVASSRNSSNSVKLWPKQSRRYALAENISSNIEFTENCTQCLGLEYSTFDTVFEVDRKFAAWEAQVPERFRWRHWYSTLPSGHFLAESGPIVVVRQSYTLNTWYLACRMNLHRMFSDYLQDDSFFNIHSI